MNDHVNGCMVPRKIERMIRRMTCVQRRTVFGPPFQQWNAGDWSDLFEGLPSGTEFAA